MYRSLDDVSIAFQELPVRVLLDSSGTKPAELIFGTASYWNRSKPTRRMLFPVRSVFAPKVSLKLRLLSQTSLNSK